MDYKRTCRICLRCDDGPRNLLSTSLRPKPDVNSNSARRLYAMLCEILNTDLSEESRIDQICECCSTELHQTYCLITKCESSTMMLNCQKFSESIKTKTTCTEFSKPPVEVKQEIIEPDDMDMMSYFNMNTTMHTSKERLLNDETKTEVEDCKNIVTCDLDAAAARQESGSYFVVEEVMDFRDVGSKANICMEIDEAMIQTDPNQIEIGNPFNQATNETRFSCSHCSQTFDLPYDLVKHARLQHKVQTFNCENCKASFIDESSLIEHLKTHQNSSFDCDECGEKFATENTLECHKRTHTGQSYVYDNPYDDSNDRPKSPINLIPEKSRLKYHHAYEMFMQWRDRDDECKTSFSETVLLKFFSEKSEIWKPSTLWAQYSMLRTTLKLNCDVDISTYRGLLGFLKNAAKGYRCTQANSFKSEEIRKFLNEAPDEDYLADKVIMIFGIVGACKSLELTKMTVKDVQAQGDIYLVKLSENQTSVGRLFTISGKFANYVKKYAALRPVSAPTERFFLNYQKGKCTVQVIGVNKLSKTPQKIAEFLKLDNPELYTGRSFQRTSGILRKNRGWVDI